MPNLLQHLENVTKVYGIPAVVALNKFPTDTDAEIKLVQDKCKELGVNVVLSEVWAKGGEGGEDLANEVVRICDQSNGKAKYGFVYDTNMSIKEEIEAVAERVYHAEGVIYSAKAEKDIDKLEKIGFHDAPVCIAKTQYSFSDDPSLIGAPRGFKIHVEDVKADAGAGFLVVRTGNIMTMPGLPKVPAAENIDVDNEGKISGLF